MIVKKRGQKWSTLLHSGENTRYIRGYIQESNWYKRCQKERKRIDDIRCKELYTYGEQLEREKYNKLKYREMKQLLADKRTQEHKSIENRAHKRELANSPDLHKHKSKQRYYTYEGVLYPYVRGKIPSKHRHKLFAR